MSSCATFAAATYGRPASSRAAPNPTPIDVVFNEDRAEFTRQRRHAHDNAGGARLGRRRCRGPPRLDREFRQPGARDRSDVLCRAGAGAAGRRRRASGLHEAVRRHRVSRRPGHHPGNAAATLTDRAGDLGGASGDRGRRGGGEAGGGDRPGPVPRPRPRHPPADCGDRRPAFVQHGRHRARSGLRPAPPRAGRTRRDRAHRLLDGGCRHRATAVLDLVDKHRDATAFDRAATLAWTQAQVQLHHLGIDPGEAGLFQRVAGHLLHAGPTLRPSSDTILRGAGGQPGLWPMGISGDLPILLLRIADIENLDIARQLLQAHEYWRMKQLAVDLVILNERASSYVQDLQIALETLVRASQSQPPDGAERRQGRVFVLRADLLSAESPRLARVGGAGRSGRTTRVARRSARPCAGTQRSCPRRAKAGGRRRGRAGGARRFAGAGPRPALEFFNGLGGFAEGRAGICDDPRAGPVDAGTLDQCHRQSGLRLSGGDRRRRLHLVGQQPREPAHALVQRSGQRSSGRGLLSARRRHRRPVVPDGTADPRRHRHLCRAAWLGIQPVRACRARHRRRSAAVRAARRSDQDLAPDAAQHVGPHPAPLGDRLRGMGAWSVAHRLRAVRDDRDRSRHRRDVRAQSMERRLRIARRLRRSRRAPDGLDGRSAGVHRPQRDTGKPGGARRPRRRSPTPWAPASILAARCAPRVVLPPNGSVEIVCFLGEAASARRRASPDCALPHGRISTPCCPRSAGTGTPSSARSR